MERLAIAMTSGLLVAFLFAAIAPNPAVAIDCGTNKSHNFFIGSRQWNDKLLYMDHPQKSSKWLRTVSTDVNTGSLNAVIDYVEILDQNTDGKGGCAYVTGGGVQTNYINIHLKSQRSHGLNFIVKVWGRGF